MVLEQRYHEVLELVRKGLSMMEARAMIPGGTYTWAQFTKGQREEIRRVAGERRGTHGSNKTATPAMIEKRFHKLLSCCGSRVSFTRAMKKARLSYTVYRSFSPEQKRRIRAACGITRHSSYADRLIRTPR